jgi:hypothetical protein
MMTRIYDKEARREYDKEYYKANREKKIEQVRKYREDNLEKTRESSRNTRRKYKRELRNTKTIKLYGITLTEYEGMVNAQKGCCTICGSLKNNELVIDHNHLTGKFRGLICATCNSGLGFFKDDAELLKKAISYLNT